MCEVPDSYDPMDEIFSDAKNSQNDEKSDNSLRFPLSSAMGVFEKMILPPKLLAKKESHKTSGKVSLQR